MAAVNCPMELVLRRDDVMLEMTRLVVVAVPEMVRPPAAVPLPMVVEAYEVRPPLNERSVDVALDGKRYPKVARPSDEVAVRV